MNAKPKPITRHQQRLTDEQLDYAEKFRDEWLSYGLNTERCDVEKAKKCVADIYKSNNMNVPKIHFLRSPMEMQLARQFVQDGGDTDNIDVKTVCRATYQAPWFNGGQDCCFLSTYFFAVDCGVEFDQDLRARMDAYKNYIINCGWSMFYKDIAFVCDRPEVLKYDDRKLLHCENGPAIKYTDGFSVYSWHGTRIPREWIEDKNLLTAEICLTEENSERKMAACAIYGWHNIIKNTKHTVIDKDDDPKIGTLIEFNLPKIGITRVIVAQCQTGRTISVTVDAARKYRTALEANAATYGCDPQTYRKYSEFRT